MRKENEKKESEKKESENVGEVCSKSARLGVSSGFMT